MAVHKEIKEGLTVWDNLDKGIDQITCCFAITNQLNVMTMHQFSLWRCEQTLKATNVLPLWATT